MTGAQDRPPRELSADLRAAVEAAKAPTYKTAAFDFRAHADVLSSGFQGAVVTDQGLGGATVEPLAESFRQTLAAASVVL